MAVVLVPPGLTDDGEREWFCPERAPEGTRGGARRPIRIGDHLAADHPLVQAWPDRFAPSAEPVDTWPVAALSADALKRRQAEQARLAPILGRRATPTCLRCGAASGESVDLFDPPTALDLNSALAGLDDHDPASANERYRIQRTTYAAARLAQQRARELAEAEARFRLEHTACPEGTPPLPEPETPATMPLHYRLATIRGSGVPSHHPAEVHRERTLADHHPTEQHDVRDGERQRGRGRAGRVAGRHHLGQERAARAARRTRLATPGAGGRPSDQHRCLTPAPSGFLSPAK